MKLCECGCGKEVNPGKRFIWHHNRRGAKLTADQIKANSIRNTGKMNPMYGVRLCGERNGFFGKKHSAETKNKIRNARLGTTLSEETIHHIDGNKKNCHPHNLITLCIGCHMSYHCILEKSQLRMEWLDTAKQNTTNFYAK